MRHALVLSLSIGLFVTAAARGDDQADGKALVDKAIKAMGGEAKLAKYKAMNTKGKGTILTPGEVAFTEESWWQPPGQYRFEMELDLAGTKVRQVFVFDGEKGWIKLGDKTEEMSKDMHAAFTDYFRALRLGFNLTELKGDGVKLSPLGEIKIGDREALGVQVVRKGQRDVNLYFDKETGLPAKSEITAKEVFGGDQEVAHEFFFSDFKEYEGIKVHTKVRWVKDGKKYLERELTDIKGEEKLEEGLFGKP
jgi:hypothetical protein